MPTHLWQGRWRGRTPAGDVHIRAREVVRPTGGIVRGKFPSKKNGRMVHYEGLLERDAIYLFEAHHRIVRYREQPCTVAYPDGTRLRRYTPDFELTLHTGETFFVEIKPRWNLLKADTQHKFGCISEHFNRISQPFLILDESNIRQEPRLRNLRWIYQQSGRIPPTDSAAINAIQRHSDEFPMPFKAAAKWFSSDDTNVFNFVLTGWLRCPLTEAVSMETTLELTMENDHDWFQITEEHNF